MTETPSLETVMRTTFSARSFTDDPVSDETVGRILDRARFAPSGGNRQGWRVLVIREDATKALFVEHLEPTMRIYTAMGMAGETPYCSVIDTSIDVEAAAASDTDVSRITDSVTGAAVLLLVLVDLEVVVAFDKDQDRVAIAPGASIFPFVWNILLAARLEGLAGVINTGLHPSEPVIKAALGIPENVALAALVPLGVPTKWLTKLSRNPVESFTKRERWDGAPFEA